jgi:hypothetical protein
MDMDTKTARELQALLREATQRALPGQALTAMETLRRRLEDEQRVLICELRREGVGWGQLASVIGVTRQALQGRVATWRKNGPLR